MACSRMPKWRLRPRWLPAWKSPAPSNVSRVLVDGARSAAPPISHGTFLATAFSTFPEESRVAIPLASGAKGGTSLSQPSGSSRCCIAIQLLGEFRILFPVLAERANQASRSARPRLPMPLRKWS